MSSILIVEDDANLSYALTDILQLESYHVIAVDNIQAARNCMEQHSIDLILLDIMLPDGNGYQFCQCLRQRQHPALVLMLSARNLEQDIVDGFLSGADDYVTKPYKSKELLLRIQALLRRQQSSMPSSNTCMLNDFSINWSLRQVLHAKKEIHLTKTAFNLLLFLFQRRNTVVSRNEILDHVWGEGVYVDNRTVDNFVYQLKRSMQLGDNRTDFIKSIRGVGYSLISPSEQ